MELLKDKTLITRGLSCFMGRKLNEDCTIWKQDDHGVRHSNGKLYSSTHRIECETGEFMKSVGAVPVTMEILKEHGFVD